MWLITFILALGYVEMATVVNMESVRGFRDDYIVITHDDELVDRETMVVQVRWLGS